MDEHRVTGDEIAQAAVVAGVVIEVYVGEQSSRQQAVVVAHPTRSTP